MGPGEKGFFLRHHPEQLLFHQVFILFFLEQVLLFFEQVFLVLLVHQVVFLFEQVLLDFREVVLFF